MRRILVALADAQGALLSAETLTTIAAGCDGDVRRAIGTLARRQFDERCEAALP